jgi:hypothetical protein
MGNDDTLLRFIFFRSIFIDNVRARVCHQKIERRKVLLSSVRREECFFLIFIVYAPYFLITKIERVREQ